jgi:hypothetical protein
MRLLGVGLSQRQVAAATGIPRDTVGDWARGQRRGPRWSADGRCAARHDFESLPGASYAYLLGIYLGDGCISHSRPRVWRLRIFLDAAYPEIIAACGQAMRSVRPTNRLSVTPRLGSRCVEVAMYSSHWPCLIPQHGPGVKHERTIRLTTWQEELVGANHAAFLRGLIHSDGCRYIARQRCRGHDYSWTRYCFSNRSEDIRALFCDSCDALGIAWRATGRHIFINRQASVAVMDRLVGPKR